MPVLRTDRLLIRPFEKDDLEAIHNAMREWSPMSLEERRRWLLWSAESARQFALLFQPPYGDRAIVRQSDGRVIGSCGLVQSMGLFGVLPSFSEIPPERREHNIPEVGLFYVIAPEERRKGYAAEAAAALVEYGFSHWNLDRIIATTEYDNEGSMAVMRKIGMRIERNPNPEPPWFQVVGIIAHPQSRKSGHSQDSSVR
jgi:RimJ/RimL family protein N-acetyltransferase